MKNKAFTLIELLAVIVVLGIIMLIAVTAVSNVISNSKTNSFKTSAMMVAKQIRNEVLPMGYTNNQTIDCLNGKYGLNPNDYDYCSANISIINDVTNVYVDLIGKGNFNGLAVVGATQGNATAASNATYQSLKTVLITAAGTNDISVNKYNGNGIYKWGTEYIFRGGITKTNAAGLATGAYATDTDSGSNPNNYVKVPWETYGSEDCSNATTNKCWRVISINTDGSITIVRDVNESNQIFDNTHNTDASTYFYNLYLSNTTTYAAYVNAQTNNYGYNNLLENVPATGHPEEYRATSLMYTKLYGTSGYQNTTLKNYYSLLNTIDVCLNKIQNYAGLNYATYSTTTFVKDTCDISGKPNTTMVNSIKSQYVRLPYPEEYLNASLESTCSTDSQYQCRNQNFIYNKGYFWISNGTFANGYGVRLLYISGYMANSDHANYSFGVRPVVNLKSTILISGGTGTTTDPYIVKS